MIDLHAHILPTVDDGAEDIDTSLAMLKIAQRNGTHTMVATPHIRENEWLAWELICEKCQQLNELVKQSGLDIQVVPGAEVQLHPDMLTKVQGPGPYCVHGSRYLLVELPLTSIPRYTEDVLFRLQLKGITPIIAHPERNWEIGSNLSLLQEWVSAGMLVQINAGSLIGQAGQRAKEITEILLLSELAHFIASDAHNLEKRNPDMSHAAVKAADIVGIPQAQQVLSGNAIAVMNDQFLEVPLVRELTFHKRNWLHRLLCGAREGHPA